MLPAYPFDLTAQGTCVLDEKTAAALSAGEATLRETYAWQYEPAEALLPPESLGSREGSCGRFLYPEKFAGSRQQIAVTYTVAITWLKEDRPPEEYAATDTLDVLVMYSGGGRILEGGAAELYLYPPAQNGQTCDMITVYAKVYTPYVFGDLQMRGADGQWYSMNPMLVESTPQYTLWCSGWSTADVPDLKNTWVDWRVVYWDYYQWPPVQHSEEESWYRYNTVVHCPAEKVLAWDPYDEGNCDTNAEFTIDHLDYGDPDWTVTVKIYDACGALIRTLVQTGGFQIGENSVEWDGNLEPPPYGPGGTAPKGLYTYVVEADHTVGSPYWPFMCWDTDKSWYLAVTNTQISSWVANLQQRKIVLQVRYTIANEDAGSVMLRVFAPDFSQLYQQQGLPTTQGQHETDPFEITMPEGGAGFGTYGVVVYAMETEAAGEEYNRDGEPKAAVQGLAHNLFVLCDLDVDSDNNDRYKDPERVPAEDEVEMVSPGKIVMRNEDDDDQDWQTDNSDTVVNGAADWNYDMAKIWVEVRPSPDTEGLEAALSASDYTKIRVFRGDGTCLLGPEEGVNQEHVFDPADLQFGTMRLGVEGVGNGEVTLSLIVRRADGGQEVKRDDVKVTVTNTLESLGLEHLWQHKDTQMLCCDPPGFGWECPTAGQHRWDCDHQQYSPACGHCHWYCVRACVAMVNHYYGGGISQDRVSYESRVWYQHGGDLGHNHGIGDAGPPLSWALGGVQVQSVDGPSWQEIMDCLVSYRPVLAGLFWAPNTRHAVVIAGYEPARQSFLVLDPARGVQEKQYPSNDLPIERIWSPSLAAVDAIVPGHDEASVAGHSDEDGVVDFDEDNRFADFEAARGYQLDKENPDSNEQPPNDKAELDQYYYGP